MHTSTTMHTSEFEFLVGGRSGTFDDALPGLTVTDRVAVVTYSPGGSLAAAPLLLASVGRYYELLRSRGESFYRYPSYYVIHVGRQQAYHGWLDVWSANKEVVVAPHGEAVLEALSDRAITRVLLEDAGSKPGELMRENANWFLEDVRDVLTFTPGRREGDFSVRSSDAAATFAVRAARASHGILTDQDIDRISARAYHPQGFDRITQSDGLGKLCAYGPTPGVLGQDDEYLRRHGAGAATMQHHRFKVS
ncbi:hypothetical protein [Rhodococcus koreensis]|uniref:hypothetical protein n=1 Tax=Rhodococcus koreensis TaxID=99653 RepID=UPI0036719BAB